MSFIVRALQILRNKSPRAWQFCKYCRYINSNASEPEIHILKNLVSRDKFAIDVGMHLGFYTRKLHSLARGVMAFEANPISAEFGRRSIGHLARIEAVALSSSKGTAELKIPIGQNGEEYLDSATISHRNALGDSNYRIHKVQTMRLDDFDMPTTGFIKIDVEGHEEEVLAGAMNLVQRDRPDMMIEIEERHNTGGLLRISSALGLLGYSTLFYKGGKLNLIGDFSFERDQSFGVSTPYINNFFFLTQKL